MKPIYLDYAATAPADPRVVEAMQPFFFEQFGNASSPHFLGRAAQKALEDARTALAGFIGASAEEVVFTSGATESNNHAVFGTARALQGRGRHIVISAVEHHSVLEPVQRLEEEGFAVSVAGVDEQGRVDPQKVADALTDGTILVALMHASNEIGTIQPVKEISGFTKAKGIPFLVDAVQTVGHIPVNADDLGADLLSLSAHKFYGPKGIGALYVRKGSELSPYLLGGDQEKNRRASTQNVAGAVGMAKAAELCLQKLDEEQKTQSRLRDRIIDGVLKAVPQSRLNGDPHNRLPNNAHFSFENLQGEALLMSLDMQGVCASMGSACTSGALEPSHVLRAMGLPDELAYGSLRVTIGRWTTGEEVDKFLEVLPAAVKQLRI